MFLTQLLYNFYIILTIFFLRSTIKHLWPTCRKTNLMIDHKKKKSNYNYKKIVQELCIKHYSLGNSIIA
jgi:hypothetical protein